MATKKDSEVDKPEDSVQEVKLGEVVKCGGSSPKR